MSSKSIKTPVQLYMHLLRQVRKLPKEAQPYYKNYVRQGFNSHSDEDDPERIQMIIERSVKDAEWIVNKYTKNET
ncbi:LYR motif-containing protein 9-like [Lingula anatina]|uniref:LYR motif-containing protein 9 n=1 Tax=Lingula anatina TaxID=7574 RepID=A0A1S3KGU2_LINAN|nr:LYR motif-containing protein 9-like [Lingula anatina]|eukprot:XP_013421707.1 LYR motif-containing protein 9-like [Lingula anatina]